LHVDALRGELRDVCRRQHQVDLDAARRVLCGDDVESLPNELTELRRRDDAGVEVE
jgi:hypothetical protein